MNDWDDLHCFTVLVEKQTLTAAAETLGVQHSTISRRIARLEATLGLRLFDRIGRRYLLTDEGARIRAQAQEIAVGMDSLLRTAREQREEMAEVVVSAPPLVAKGLLMPHFAAPSPAAMPTSASFCKATHKSATCTRARRILRCASSARRKTT